MSEDTEITSKITKEEISFFVFLCLIFSVFYVWDSSIYFIYKLIHSILVIFVFYFPTLSPSMGFGGNSLNKRIGEEIRKTNSSKNSNWVLSHLSTIYNPSVFSVITILSIGVVINLPAFYFPWFKSSLIISAAEHSNYFNNLIGIHAGIGAIIFALLIFVAESLRDDSKERASVLLKESLLFPLTFLEIITFLFFIGFQKQNILASIPVFIVGCLAMYALYKLMKILLSPYEFQKKRLVLLKDRVKNSIDEAIKERIGNNILNKFLEDKNNPLSGSFLSKRHKKEYLIFKVNEVGIIKDINMNVLSKIGELVESQANSKGFSFFENKPKPPKSSSQEAISTSQKEFYTNLQRWDASLTKFYHNRLEPDSNDVLIISRKISGGDKVFEETISGLVKELFIIGKENNFSEEIKLELEALRDQFIEAIKEIKITKIDYFKEVYLSLAETFLDLIIGYGGGFTPEQAKKEMSVFYGEGWSEIEWLDNHLRSVFTESINTLNKDLIRKVAFIPIAVAIRGLRKNDHFIFQKFIKYSSFLHYKALEVKDNEALKKDMAEHSITWLKEVSDYYIEPDLESEPDKIKFTFQILLQFQEILRYSFNKKDFVSFEYALGSYKNLLKRFKPSEEYPNTEHLAWEYNRAEDEKQKKDIQERIDIQKKLEDAEKEFTGKKRQLLFGLTAWIFKIIRKDGDSQNRKQFFDSLKSLLPQDVKDITALFIESKNHEVQSNFGWDWWDTIPDGEVHVMEFGEDLEYLYILLSLESMKNMTPDEIAQVTLPFSRDLAFLAEKNSTLDKKLSNVESIPNFNLFIGASAKEKIDSFKGLIEKARKDQEEKERLEVIDRPLSDKKIEEFKALFLKEFYSHASLRALFNNHGKLIDKTKESEAEDQPTNMWGYNQIDSKEGFFEDWHVHYVGWGEQYGEGFARSEDGLIYEKVSKGLVKKEHISFIDLISKIEKELESNTYKTPYLFSPFAYSMEMQTLRASEKFVASWDDRKKGHQDFRKYHFYVGYLELGTHKVPIFRVIGSDKTKNRDACLVDVDKIGTLVQYPPIKDIGDENFTRDIFLIKIIDLNLDNEKRQKIINDNPEWLKDKNDPEAYLKGKVLLNIYAKIDFIVQDKTAGIYFSFKEKEEELN